MPADVYFACGIFVFLNREDGNRNVLPASRDVLPFFFPSGVELKLIFSLSLPRAMNRGPNANPEFVRVNKGCFNHCTPEVWTSVSVRLGPTRRFHPVCRRFVLLRYFNSAVAEVS